MLDFAQIDQGNFKKNVHEFNIKDAIDELTNIQMLKAEASGVNLIVKMKEFPRNNYLVQSDQERIQQVVLNLLSNGIKYTNNGGHVSIECKYIDHIEDLHHKDHVPFFEKS
jgi:signal transduction histidine kinase